MVRGRENTEAVSAVKKGYLLPLVSVGPSGIGGEWQWEVGCYCFDTSNPDDEVPLPLSVWLCLQLHL